MGLWEDQIKFLGQKKQNPNRTWIVLHSPQGERTNPKEDIKIHKVICSKLYLIRYKQQVPFIWYCHHYVIITKNVDTWDMYVVTWHIQPNAYDSFTLIIKRCCFYLRRPFPFFSLASAIKKRNNIEPAFYRFPSLILSPQISLRHNCLYEVFCHLLGSRAAAQPGLL